MRVFHVFIVFAFVGVCRCAARTRVAFRLRTRMRDTHLLFLSCFFCCVRHHLHQGGVSVLQCYMFLDARSVFICIVFICCCLSFFFLPRSSVMLNGVVRIVRFCVHPPFCSHVLVFFQQCVLCIKRSTFARSFFAIVCVSGVFTFICRVCLCFVFFFFSSCPFCRCRRVVLLPGCVFVWRFVLFV